jgi:predicted component of type VI protein secretion system
MGNTANQILLDSASTQEIIDSLNSAIMGNLINTGTFTITENTTTTAVKNSLVSGKSHITLTAESANAAAEEGAGTMYISEKKKGQFTVTHANNAQTDRNFSYAIFG